MILCGKKANKSLLSLPGIKKQPQERAVNDFRKIFELDY